MEYRVVITSDAEEDLEGFIRYLLFEKKNVCSLFRFYGSLDSYFLLRVNGLAITANVRFVTRR